MDIVFIGDDLGPYPPSSDAPTWLEQAEDLLEGEAQDRLAAERILDEIVASRPT